MSQLTLCNGLKHRRHKLKDVTPHRSKFLILKDKWRTKAPSHRDFDAASLRRIARSFTP